MFQHGIGHTDDPWLLGRFKEKGFEVKDEPEKVELIDLEQENLALKKENETLKAKIAELENDTDWNEPSFDRDAAKAELTRLGIDFKGNASNDTLKKLLEGSK